MKLSENDVFKRKLKELLDDNCTLINYLDKEIIKLIEEHEEEPCKCHEKICFEVSDREKEENDISSDFVYG